LERQHRCGRGADTDRTPLLIDAIDGLARLAAYLKQRTALVIDDLQKIIELGGQTTEPQIRAAIQRHTELGFVFEGSKTELLNDMTLNPALPFYHMGVRHFLGPLPRDARGVLLAPSPNWWLLVRVAI
jgi:hypothetical protein